MTIATQTIDELRAELRKGSPHLDGELLDREAVFKVKADHYEAWLEALLEASSDPARAKELCVDTPTFPRRNGSGGAKAGDNRKRGVILVANGLLTHEKRKEIEAQYDQ